ncbi:hypothetical protein ALC53_09869 [Atta colombica]|uniref:C2 domain-containing protein n=1 Tax=Atta colombica TaxID=520822 RepID=A0A151I1I3_9HYME|nr:hypothetical protein ALC53_09869 [Atta colombica]
MPGKIKVKILAGRNLPVMDRSGDTTDAYVELKFGNITYKTDVCRKSLNPQWNSEWYRFEVDDAELQDEPLQIRLMDHDTYSANDAIGKVYINLNPLLLPGSVMTGWIPVYDTMHGIRGEVNIIIKVELFSDFNKFRQSSCGVQFFYSPNIPYGYHAQMIHGFVEELVVSDDPEYKWIDKIRTPRASNEARQTLFFKLSGEVQRKIGLKALDLGGNAVIGYLQNFDLEGESGIVARGIGTAVTLVKLHDVLGFPCDSINIEEIAFALSSRTIARTERYSDNSAPFIPFSIPASYPIRRNRNLPFYMQSTSSLTRLERAIKAPGYFAEARRKHVKRIPFLRSNTSSMVSLRITTSNSSDVTPSPEISRSLIDETMRSIRTMLMSEDTKKESPKDRLSKQIKHLRSKFDSVGEENHSAAKSDSETNTINSFAMNPEKDRSLKDTKTGGIMAALLIGSIHNMPLENIKNTDPISVFPSEEQLNEEIKKETCCTQNPYVDSNIQSEEQKQDVASLIDETETSSFDDSNSTDDELSEDTTSYNILEDSRYSIDRDSDKAEDSSSLQERIPITHSSAESCTDSTLQMESMNRSLSSLNLASTEDIQNDTIPIIIVDTQDRIDSDSSGFSNSESQSDIINSYVLTEANIFTSELSHSSDNQETDNLRQVSDTSENEHKKNLKIENDKRHSNVISRSSISETHHVYLMKHEQDLSARLKSPSCTEESEECINADKEKNDLAINLPYVTTWTSLSNKEGCAMATIERRRSMRDLIKLIDTKMMVPTCHSKRNVSLRSKKRKLEKIFRKDSRKSRNSFDKFPSHSASTRRCSSHRCHKKNVLHVPRVRSIPERLSSGQHPIPYVTSHSCGSSLVSLTDRTRTSPSPIFHRPHDGSSGTSGKSLRNGRRKPDAISAVSVSCICNLEKTSCHIDCAMPTNNANITYNSRVSHPSPDLRQQDETSVSPSCPLPAVATMAPKMSQSPATRTLANVPLHRRSSDSDLSVTPKGNSLGSDRSIAGPLRTPTAVVRPMNQDTLEMLEYPFITMQHYPPGFILHIGGLVSSKSVKLLERISNLEEPEGRDSWWTEIRMEVRSHARALACNVVIGYKEETSICDDVCVLSASGTAAVINFHNSSQDSDSVVLNKLQQSFQLRCNLCHLPYSEGSVPFRVNVSKCAICKRAKVPDVMFTTIEVPANIPMTGRGCFIQATVCKSKKDLRGELNAKEISDCLPFLEYELHSLLLNKLKIKGMNAVFGLRLQVSVGERLVIGMAVGTAIYLTALPPPTIPQIASGNSWHNEEQLGEMQKSIVETVKKNREFYRLKSIGVNEVENGRIPSTSDTDESDEDLPELDLGLGTRDACVLEVDDIEDMDRISSLMDNRPPDDFHVVNTQTIPGLEDLEIVRNLQMFTQISRAKIPMGQFASMPSKYFARLLQSLYFKLRRMVPCALCDMQFKIALPEQDEIQLTVVGMALGLGEPLNTNKYKRKIVCRSLNDSDMIFSLDEDHLENNVISDNATRTCTGNPTLSGTPVQKPRPRSPLRIKSFTSHRRKHMPLKGRYGVDITPLSYLPGGRIERYQGNLNFFFIRESTSIRENGGLSGFTHSFVMEVLAIVRAHITALGGNAMVAFFMTQCVLLHSPHKNQGQCLINVGGDVVTVSYYADEKHSAVSNC